MKTLIGPFREMLTMRQLPLRGALKDEQLEIIVDGGVVVDDGVIVETGQFESLFKHFKSKDLSVVEISEAVVALPGFIDAHTHLCFAGTRARDFAARNNGKTYLEIAKAGGGIWDTVQQTRKATESELVQLINNRLDRHLRNGITTVEIKSGYGLSVEQEYKSLKAIKQAKESHMADVVATCLAAHIIPKDGGNEKDYLQKIIKELVPLIQKQGLVNRFDIFIEESAFSESLSKAYLKQLKKMGFDLTVHGDQFHTGGSKVAIECGAVSVDHLEASGEKEIMALAKSETIPVALPGASIGIGCPFTPARKLLDAGCSLAIASDWNPGSAPQGNLLMQASVLGAFEKLSATEVFSALTFRAANALNINDRGRLAKNQIADFITFPTPDYREILYHQGELKVNQVWKKGKAVL